ncbi:thioredoxin family protein [bacterium]|nr:thioredoxin family protein [bacterium]
MTKSGIRIFAALLFVAAALAQDGDGGGPVSPGVAVRAYWSTNAIAVGGQSDLGLVFSVPKKHHITDGEFGLFFVEIRDTLGLAFGKPAFPKGEAFHEEVCYRGEVLVRVPVTASADATAGDYTIPVNVGYQICQEYGEGVCFLPEDKTLQASAQVVPAGPQIMAATADVFVGKDHVLKEEPKSWDERLTAALEKGSWTAFLIAFLGGILASFTPCVYPVIPITIGYIGGSSQGKPMRGLALSAIFSLGIAIVYSSLGLFAAATGTLFGSISGSPIVNIVIAAVFGLMGFSMLGAFDIALPAALQSSLTGGAAKRGLLGPLILGMASGLVMAPCVGPIIVALLAWVAQSGDLFYGWALLFTFSFGLGILFLVIGTFAGAIQALPRAGSWMEVIKKSFGWILLAGAIYMLRLTLPPMIYSLVWAVLLITFSVLVGAFDSISSDATPQRRTGKALALVMFVVGAAFIFKALAPSGGVGVVTEARSEMEWAVNKEEAALEAAQSSGKPLIIDVYADWCVACVELDEKTWIVPDVQKRLDGFVRLKLDFTKETEWVSEMKKKYKITGMPTVILKESGGEEITRFTGFKPSGEFLSLLDEHSL